MQTTGKAGFIAQHQAVELLMELRKGHFVLFCHSVNGQRTAGKMSLFSLVLEYHIAVALSFINKFERRLRYIALSLRQDCE